MADAVQGSLDAPPIVVTSDPAKTVGYILLATVLFAAFVLLPYNGRPLGVFDIVLFWFLRIVSGLCIAAFIAQLFRPARLELSSTGIAQDSLFRTVSVPWSDIASFTYYRHAWYRRMPSFIYASMKPGAARRRGLGFTGGWRISTSDLNDLLNAALARWGK